MKFSPQLLPNNPAGITPDLALLTPISDYMASDKADGGRRMRRRRISIRRSLKPIPSEHIKAMTKDLSLLLHEGYVEAELYSPNMNFAEIMHFFRSRRYFIKIS
jgi:hypothetical protein